MTSKHLEAIAALLQLSGANKTNGITVNDIQSKSDIPRASIFRILGDESEGFFKSRYPSRPQGYYFDEDLAADNLSIRINNSVSNMTSIKRANDLLAKAEKTYENISPIIKPFLHIKLSDKELESKLLVRLNGKAIKVTWPELISAISTADNKDSRVAYLLLALKSLEENAINDLNSPTESKTIEGGKYHGKVKVYRDVEEDGYIKERYFWVTPEEAAAGHDKNGNKFLEPNEVLSGGSSGSDDSGRGDGTDRGDGDSHYDTDGYE